MQRANMVAIITARGGSKRIPRKNIKEFMGKPMLAYAIEAARKSALFDVVMVSTDDREIAEIAVQYGAEVPFMRSEATASDYATTFDVVEEVIREYKKEGKEFDKLCCIYPCVPFLTADSLIKACEKLTDSVDAVQPVCSYPVPVEWAFTVEDGFLKAQDEAAMNIRSQDIQDKYYDVGMFYFVRTESMIKYKSLHPPKTAAYMLSEMECEDIDTVDDWNMAELKYRMLHQEVSR